MSPVLVRLAGAGVGVATVVGGGIVAGGWWWLAAAAGVVGAVGGMFDRQLAFALVLSALALVGGVVDSGHDWVVALLATGTVASIELAAAADRVTVVRSRVTDLGQVIRTIPAVVALSSAVLVVGNVSDGGPALAPVGAALAAVVAIRVIAR